MAKYLDCLPPEPELELVSTVQDTARSFAGTHNDKAKFEVYMEATHFRETIENLKRAADHVGGMLDILHRQGTHVRVCSLTATAH